MSESAEHSHLVTSIATWVMAAFANHTRGLYLLCDLPEQHACDKPWAIDGFVPDVFAGTFPASFALVGEAKRNGDLTSARSARQMRAFLEFLGSQRDPHFIIAVPPSQTATARRLLRNAARELHVDHVALYSLTPFGGAIRINAAG